MSDRNPIDGSNNNTVTPLSTVLQQLRKQASTATKARSNQGQGEELGEKIRAKKIENDNKENDQKLKKSTLELLFSFLAVESIVIFSLAFFQGFHLWCFHLDEWSFRLVVTATLGQITAMLIIAVQHLFPKK